MRYLLACLLAFTFFAVRAGGGGCGTVMTEDYKQHYYSKDMSYLNEQGARAGIRWVPIVYHILTKDDGTGGIGLKPIFDSHCELNQAYNQFDIGFFIMAIDSIKDTDLYSDPYPSGWSTFSQLNEPNVCNVYISPDLDVCGFATYPGPSSGGGIFLNKSCYGKGSTTLHHEMGHWLDLPHTFEETNPVEYINGSNCSSKGDRFCDTPADFVDYRASCPYNGLEADPNGDLYKDTIDETLYMSYFMDNCQNRFSPMQQAEMNHSLTNERPNILNHPTPDLSALPIATFVYPVNGDTTLLAGATTFSWNSIPGAAYYVFTLQSATSSVLFADTVVRDTFITVSNLSPSKGYKFKVKGLSYGNACSSFTPDQFITTSAIKAVFGVVSPSCPGQADAQIQITPNNGTGPYTVSWSTGHIGSNISNLTAGSYYITITDANGEVAIAEVQVKEPVMLDGTINKVGPNLTASATGGTPPYTYSWNNGETGAGNNGITFGTYTVTITDSRGCTTTKTFIFSTLADAQQVKADIQVFPNPANSGQQLQVLVNVSAATEGGVFIRNLNGQTITQGRFNFVTGSNSLSFDLSNYTAGVYLLQFSNGGVVNTSRFSVVK
jgi:hypothetical protein